MKPRLNLVLHGLFVGIVPDDQHIELWVPYFAAHQYEWEHWGQPRLTMTGGGTVHNLQGVSGSAGSVGQLQPNYNTVFRKECPVISNPSLHSKIVLPFPNAIWSMRRVCRNAAPFYSGGSALPYLYQQPDEIAMVHVFEYTIEDVSKLSYEGHPVTVNPWNQTVSLHIWADEFTGAHIPPPPTPVEQTVTRITGLNIQQDPAYQGRSGALDPNEPHPDGMEYSELYTRYERTLPGWGRCDDPLQRQPCDFTNLLDAKIVHCMAVFISKLP